MVGAVDGGEMRFSERYGYREIRTALQHESMDDGLRVDLWNQVLGIFGAWTERYGGHAGNSPFAVHLWTDFLRRPLDELPNMALIQSALKDVVLRGEWFRVYDLLEYFAEQSEAANDYGVEYKIRLRQFNEILKKHLAAYRFVDGRISPIDSAVDLAAVEEALTDAEGLAGVRHHLQRALELLSDRESPDYTNSVKESISAVEAICALITGQRKPLGDALKRLKDSGLTLHPALENAWSKLYGYTSDADGIRHFALDTPTVDQGLAKYFLVSCSAFVSLLITEAANAGLALAD